MLKLLNQPQGEKPFDRSNVICSHLNLTTIKEEIYGTFFYNKQVTNQTVCDAFNGQLCF